MIGETKGEMLNPSFISEEQYDRLEEVAFEKHEYFNGQMYAMPGGNNPHAVLCTNASCELHTGLKGKSYRAVGGLQRIKIEATGLQTYADASVYSDNARFAGNGKQMLLSPIVIVEVLSPETEKDDRGDKWYHYQKLPSLQDYLLITQSYVRVEHFHRHDNESWLLKSYNSPEQVIQLESIDSEIQLADLYDGIELSEILPLRVPDYKEDE